MSVREIVRYTLTACLHTLSDRMPLTCADDAERSAQQGRASIAALHSDWHLLLQSILLILDQSSSSKELCSNLVDDPCFAAQFSNIVAQLQPNPAAQCTAAAVFCKLHAEALAQQHGHRVLQEAVFNGHFGGVKRALIDGCLVRLIHGL